MIRPQRYADRQEAGAALAQALAERPDIVEGTELVLLALPRGGVPVAKEVATRLAAPLDVLVVRKLGVPWQRELAMGALGPYDTLVMSDYVVRATGVSPDMIKEVVARESAELARQEALYRAGRPPLDLEKRTVIVIDDGLATGASARVAARAVRSQHPAKLVIAVPVGARETVNRLAAEVDEVVCPMVPPAFSAVGEWYVDFRQVSDEEVLAALSS